MPENSNLYFKSYLKILKNRGISSLFDEIKDNLLFDLINGTSTQIREGKSTDNYKHYSPSYSSLIVESIRNLNIKYKNYNFIDLGSGKGKATLIASKFRFKKIIGVELYKKLINAAKENQKIFFSKKWNKTYRCKIEYICSDAEKYSIKIDKNIYFMFDPFTEKKLKKMLKKITFQKKIVNYIIALNPPDIIKKYPELKLIKTIHRNTYSGMIFKIN
jgi:tRNA1(Val) A37 N6-methylase TrmN6